MSLICRMSTSLGCPRHLCQELALAKGSATFFSVRVIKAVLFAKEVHELILFFSCLQTLKDLGKPYNWFLRRGTWKCFKSTYGPCRQITVLISFAVSAAPEKICFTSPRIRITDNWTAYRISSIIPEPHPEGHYCLLYEWSFEGWLTLIPTYSPLFL